jgi:hypothetical protein
MQWHAPRSLLHIWGSNGLHRRNQCTTTGPSLHCVEAHSTESLRSPRMPTTPSARTPQADGRCNWRHNWPRIGHRRDMIRTTQKSSSDDAVARSQLHKSLHKTIAHTDRRRCWENPYNQPHTSASKYHRIHDPCMKTNQRPEGPPMQEVHSLAQLHKLLHMTICHCHCTRQWHHQHTPSDNSKSKRPHTNNPCTMQNPQKLSLPLRGCHNPVPLHRFLQTTTSR